MVMVSNDIIDIGALYFMAWFAVWTNIGTYRGVIAHLWNGRTRGSYVKYTPPLGNLCFDCSFMFILSFICNNSQGRALEGQRPVPGRVKCIALQICFCMKNLPRV